MKAVIHPVTLRDASYVLQNLRPRDFEETKCQTRNWDPQALAAATSQIEYAWTVKLDGNPEAVFGAQPMSATTVVAWALGTKKIERVIPLLTRFILGPLNDQLVRDGYSWAEARSITSHRPAHKWLTGLGFQRAAELPRYGTDGEDFILFRAPLLR